MAKKVQSAPLSVTVTTLEMTAPPKQSLPVPVNVQTAILGAPDIPLAFYRFLYRQVGYRWHWVDRPASQLAQRPQEGVSAPTTRSPGRNPVTCAPTASTTPAISWPTTTGRSVGTVPVM